MFANELNVDALVTFTYNNTPRMGKVVRDERAKDYVKVELIEGVVKTFKVSQMKDLIATPQCDVKLFP